MLPLIFLSLFYFMISIKNLIIDYKDIPETWIFEHYCKLNRKLIGQDEKIKSMFNSKDTVPSMCIYFNKSIGKYALLPQPDNRNSMDDIARNTRVFIIQLYALQK